MCSRFVWSPILVGNEGNCNKILQKNTHTHTQTPTSGKTNPPRRAEEAKSSREKERERETKKAQHCCEMRGGEEETPQNGRQLKSKSLHLRRLPPPFTGLYRVSIRCSGVVSRCSAFFLLFFQFRYVTETGRVRADHCDWLGLLFVLTTILCWMVR